MNRSAIICLFISLLFFPNLITSAPLAPALYVFGDSLYEVGNNNHLPTLAKVNYPPYGNNFIPSNFIPVSSGRFTNGKVVPDFIAEYLQLPYPPPFLSIDLFNARLTGVSYASGSCGILPESGRLLGRCIQLSEQVDAFEKTITELKKKILIPEAFLDYYLSKAILLVNIGSNDYINNYLDERENSSKGYGPEQYAQLLVDKLTIQLKRIYDLGGRKIILSELGPIGCIPYVTRKGNNHEKCDDKVNQMILKFNSKLRTMLSTLKHTLQDSKFVLVHTYDVGMEPFANPSKQGEQDLVNPCCNAWGNGTTLCIPLQTPCPNPDKNYYWDGYHLTEAVYSSFASRCISDSSVCSPYNLKEFVKL